MIDEEKQRNKNIRSATNLYSELEIRFVWLIDFGEWSCTLYDGFYEPTKHLHFIHCTHGKTIDEALDLALEYLGLKIKRKN